MFAPSAPGHVGSRLLNSLPAEEYSRICRYLEVVNSLAGEVVYEAGEKIEYIYFPINSIIFWLCTVENGATIEIGIFGNEGALGVSQVLGDGAAPYRAVVQLAGRTLRMRSSTFCREFERGGPFKELLLRYNQAFIKQISQVSVCHRLHTIEQQQCRLLLLSHDRVGSDELLMTQELIANLLGVRREGITYAARHLQSEGLVSYVRGHIRIRDRRGLEAAACECYEVIEREYDNLLRTPSARLLRRAEGYSPLPA